MSLSTAETIGFANQFIQLLQDNKTDLQTKGLDVSEWITEITALSGDAVTKDSAQDEARVAMKTATAESQAATKLVYKTSSMRLDAVIGVLGKDTAIGRQAGRLRSDLIQQSKKKTDEESASGNS